MKTKSNYSRFRNIFKAACFFSFPYSCLFASSVTAQTTVDFHQAGNEGHPLNPISWVSGTLSASSSDYFEGAGVPQRIILTGITPTPGDIHTLTFRHQAVKGGVRAYDFLISWTQAVQTAANIGNGNVNELQNLWPQRSNQALSPSGSEACMAAIFHVTASVPDNMGEPSTVSCGFPPPISVNPVITCFESMFGDRTIDIYGDAAITSATVTFDGYSDINQDSYANYSLTWTSTSTKVVILTAGHLAQSCTSAWCCGYGFGCGAGNITGACHFKLSNLDNNSLGNQDNQLHFIGQFPTVIAPEDVEIYISSEFPLCNTSVTFYLNYYNQGTVPASGRIEYEIDPLVTYNSATPSPDSISGNFLIWYYSNLATNQSPLITLNLTLPGAGDTIVNTATIIAIDSLENLVDSSSYNYTRIIGCSYDPNDKTVNPQGETEHHYTPMDSQLDYTIRFQNTGTAPATRVEIIDTLSNPLDLNSLRIISSSHLMSFYVNGKTIHFVFDNINLPDSNTNEQASHGYVFYRVKPEENLSELTTVKNTAHIFFDLNAAVATNTTQNIFTSFPASTICTSGNGNIQKVRICHNNKTLCVDANAVTPHLAHGDYVGSCTSNREQTFEGDNADLENVYVFPNPTSGLFTLKFSGAISKDISLRITNVIGEIIYQQNSVSENYLVNLSHIPDGLYFISLRIDGKLIQKKITLTR